MTARSLPPEWSVTCPWCHAPPGTRCTSPRGRRIPVDSHDARLQAAAALVTAEAARRPEGFR